MSSGSGRGSSGYQRSGGDVYQAAGAVLTRLEEKKDSTLKAACLQSPFQGKKMLTALVSQTVRYGAVIEALLEASGLLEVERGLDPRVARCMVHDVCIGTGLKCGGKLKKTAARHASRLKLKVRAKAKDTVELLPPHLQVEIHHPRYARVNLLKREVADIVADLVTEGFELKEVTEQAELLLLPPGSFAVDPHLHDLIVFAPKTDLHDNVHYKEGELILQDKASCFPAHALQPPHGAHCIDSCAAPGNKTSHLAAFMRNTGKVYAFDISEKRLNLLKRLHALAGVQCVVPTLGSFLEAKPDDPRFAKVEYVLCDPSCSGSGIASRLLDDAAIEAGDASTDSDKSSGGGGGGSGGSRVCFAFQKGNCTKGDDCRFDHVTEEESSSGGGGGSSGGGGGAGDDSRKRKHGGGGGGGGGGKKKKGSWGGSNSTNGRPTVPIIKPAASPAELHAADRADNRLQLLAKFQHDVVTHAMDFPSVKFVSYSTCSVHQEENEGVVRSVLAAHPDFELVNSVAQWPHRGIAASAATTSGGGSKVCFAFQKGNCDRGDDCSFSHGGGGEASFNLEHVVRTEPNRDHATGMFVALFHRKGASGREVVAATNKGTASGGGGGSSGGGGGGGGGSTGGGGSSRGGGGGHVAGGNGGGKGSSLDGGSVVVGASEDEAAKKRRKKKEKAARQKAAKAAKKE